MNSAFRPLIVVGIVVAAMAGFALLRNAREPADITPWRTTLADAQQESKTSGKPVLAYFTASWCPPCQQMKYQTWPDPQVQNALKAFVPVKIDVDASADIAQQFGVTQIPRLQLIAPDGVPGRARIGLILPTELVHWLQGS